MDASASTLTADFALSSCTAAFVWFYMALIRGPQAKGSFVESDGSKGMVKHPTILQTDFTTLSVVLALLTCTCGGTWFATMCSPFCVPPAGAGWTGRYLWFLLDMHDVKTRTEFAPVAGKGGVMRLARDEDFLR